MSDHNVPNDTGRYTVTMFIAFVVVFVFAMIMMLWHGSYEREADGKMKYNTSVNEPTDGD